MMHHHLNGWKKDPEDPRDYRFKVSRAGRLPKAIDLRRNMSPVEDQGQLGSCVAHALVGALEYLDVKDGGSYMDDSRLFTYWTARAIDGFQEEDNGAYIRSGIKALARQGCCSEKAWPYKPEKVLVRPSQSCFLSAVRHRIASYSRITDKSGMLTCLASGFPFAFGITLFDSFDSDKVADSGIVNMPEPGEKDIGGHAVLAAGYFGDRLIVRNSWGTDWGQAGYFTIPIAYLIKYGDDFWTIRKQT